MAHPLRERLHPSPEPAEYIARAAVWIASQDPRAFYGRFVDSQGLLARAGLLDHPPLAVESLARADLTSSPRHPVPLFHFAGHTSSAV